VALAPFIRWTNKDGGIVAPIPVSGAKHSFMRDIAQKASTFPRQNRWIGGLLPLPPIGTSRANTRARAHLQENVHASPR